MVREAFWLSKKVFITGHAGFKGSWLAFWLLHLGAEVKGFMNLSHHRGDIRDAELVTRLIKSWQPDVIFHLAAQ